jgi:hypothetical protein
VTENGLEHGIIVGQHGDDDLAIEQVADVRCGPETQRRKLRYLIGATEKCNYRASSGREICSHRRSHATKTDQPYFAHDRPATG